MGLEDIVMRSERIVVMNDLQIPFQDRKSLDAVQYGLKDMKPDVIYLNGDIVDFYSLSRFDKDPERRLNLQSELTDAKIWLDKFRRANKNSRIVFIMGNHEERLQKYIRSRAPELEGLPGNRVDEVLGLKKIGIEYESKRYHIHDGILISHLDRASKWGSARAIGLEHGKSVIHGHSHKMAHFKQGDKNFYDNGCLCKLDLEYLDGPSVWSQGFMVADKVKNKWRYDPITIDGNEYMWNGSLYTPNGRQRIKTKQERQKKKASKIPKSKPKRLKKR